LSQHLDPPWLPEGCTRVDCQGSDAGCLVNRRDLDQSGYRGMIADLAQGLERCVANKVVVRLQAP
jgi:hypothetical protein